MDFRTKTPALIAIQMVQHGPIDEARDGDNDNMTRWMMRRDGLYSYVRRVPELFADVDPRQFAEESPGTRDLRQALKLRDLVNAEQERLWAALKSGRSDNASVIRRILPPARHSASLL